MDTIKEAHLLPILEEDSTGILEQPITAQELDVAEAKYENAKTQTAKIAQEAEGRILELQKLLKKTKIGTATRHDKERLAKVNSKLSKLKREVAESKTVEKSTEMEFLRSSTRMKVTEVKTAMKEKDIRRAIQAIRLAESVDVAFIIDCTSSMAPYIESVKNSIRQIVDRVVSTNSDANLRFSIVGYRDLRDSRRFEVMDFSPSVENFKTFLASIHASGGDDAPEDMAGAIKEANKLKWKNLTKLAFIIADAPCHGSEFHDYEDFYPDGTPGIDIFDELVTLQEKEGLQGTMTITFGRITEATDSMIQVFQEYGISINEANIEECSKLTKSVTSSVRKSIFKTVTCIGKPGLSVSFAPIDDMEEVIKGGRTRARKTEASLKDYTISSLVPTAIDWTRQPFSKVKVYRNIDIKKVSDLQEPIKIGLIGWLKRAVTGKASMSPTDKTVASTMLIRRAPSPFAEGGIRLAYHGQLSQKVNDLGKKKNRMVFKSFKHLGKRVHDIEQYLKQMEASGPFFSYSCCVRDYYSALTLILLYFAYTLRSRPSQASWRRNITHRVLSLLIAAISTCYQ